MVALGVATLAACGSYNNNSAGNGSTGSAGGTGTVTAACKLDSPPTSGARPPKSVDLGKASGKVGVILPDTTSSTRYTLYDKPLLTKALTDAGITADVQNAQGDKNKFASIAQNMIGAGRQGPDHRLDRRGVRRRSREVGRGDAGVKVIDYDRVNLGGTRAVLRLLRQRGRRQAAGADPGRLPQRQKVSKPKIIKMDGGTDVDNNAVLFKKGAHSVLDPLADRQVTHVAGGRWSRAGTVENAAPAFHAGPHRCRRPGRRRARGQRRHRQRRHRCAEEPGPRRPGRRSPVRTPASQGIQNIITGKQSMTVFKNVKRRPTPPPSSRSP